MGFRILHIDLTDSKVWTETTPEEWVPQYLGSRGVNARLLWRELRPHTDPLSPANPLIFGAGLLTGTHCPCSGRIVVTTKSPATNLYLKTNSGGHWGAQLRYAGYSGLVIHGKAKSPVYVQIEDHDVQILSAEEEWGKDIRETNALLRDKLSEGQWETAVIGPAGENLVRFAAIMVSTYHAAGRGGAGAVMGSKNLKAIAVNGTQGLKVARPCEFNDLVMRIRETVLDTPGVARYYNVGTAGSVLPVNELRAFPCNNFTRGYMENAYAISGHRIVDDGYLKRREACFACPISCHRYTEVHGGKYDGTYGGGPEYETLSALGGGCGVDDFEAVVKAGVLANIMGLDTISTGSVIQWLIECYERGIVDRDQVDGLDLAWGNGDAVIALVEKIAYREGVGNILAEGVRQAAEEIGHDSWKWAVEAKGLEQSRVDTRSAKAYALAFAVNPRGPDHLHAMPMAETGLRPDMVSLIEKITGDAKLANPYTTEKRADIVRWHEDVYAVTDSLGLCTFATLSTYVVTPELMAKLVTYSAGPKITEAEIMQAGRRTITLERLLNIREGLSRADDRLPWRLMNEELPDRAGAINSQNELDKMLDEYYALHGWEVATGYPTMEILGKLGLADLGAELQLPSKQGGRG